MLPFRIKEAAMPDKPIVLVTRKLPDEVEDRLQRSFTPILNPDDKLYSADDLVRLSDGAFAILPCHTEHFSADVVARLPESVKVVANFSVGVDHCDLAAARERGLIVTNTPDVLSDATAEIAILLMLGAARRAGEGEQLVRSAGWRDWSPKFMVGTQVTGKRLGIIGMGRVGQVVARRARGLDMEIHYYNRNRLAAGLEAGAVFHETLESLLNVSQFLSIHCPATPESRGLMNADRIAELPDGAVLINTARGAVVDDDALIEALGSGKLAAAGLDVFNNEPEIDPRYRTQPNTFLLPHIGSATTETRIAMGNRAIDNLEAIAAGREPADRVA